MARDIEAARHPYIALGERIIEEARERRRAPRPPGEPAMEANRHHFRPLGALGMKVIEAVLEIGEELIAGIEALRRRKAHIVGIERVGHDELWPVRALRANKADRPHSCRRDRRSLALPSRAGSCCSKIAPGRSRAGARRRLCVCKRIASVDVVPLNGGRDVPVVDPSQAVARDLEACLLHSRDGVGVARHGVPPPHRR